MSQATQSAEFSLEANPLVMRASVTVTPNGLLAIAALVGVILLATAVLVQSAKK